MDNATRICQLDGCENPIISVYKKTHGCSREHGAKISDSKWYAKIRARELAARAERADAIAKGEITIEQFQSVCRNEECSKTFMHTNPLKKYCTTKCSTRWVYLMQREERIAKASAYYRRHKDAIRIKNKEYNASNFEFLSEQRKAYRLANKEACARISREWRKANPERHREHNRKRRGWKLSTGGKLNHTHEQMEAKVAYWGWQCWMCGGEWKEIDHVKPLSKGGPHILANMRPACRPCNNKKRAKWNGVSGLRAHLNVPSDIKRAG